jgi:hypothetical protein
LTKNVGNPELFGEQIELRKENQAAGNGLFVCANGAFVTLAWGSAPGIRIK